MPIRSRTVWVVKIMLLKIKRKNTCLGPKSYCILRSRSIMKSFKLNSFWSLLLGVTANYICIMLTLADPLWHGDTSICTPGKWQIFLPISSFLLCLFIAAFTLVGTLYTYIEKVQMVSLAIFKSSWWSKNTSFLLKRQREFTSTLYNES